MLQTIGVMIYERDAIFGSTECSKDGAVQEPCYNAEKAVVLVQYVDVIFATIESSGCGASGV